MPGQPFCGKMGGALLGVSLNLKLIPGMPGPRVGESSEELLRSTMEHGFGRWRADPIGQSARALRGTSSHRLSYSLDAGFRIELGTYGDGSPFS
mmetsp:Transcript_78005/g.215721  ORF Transcript_78005/g.215721 Transcript_78005/m.215721 type:complete len:94 (+) Transcript_78005:659-940(+)